MHSTPRSTLLSLLIAGTAAAQSAHLDQSYLPSPLTNGLEVTANQPVTQTFTVGRTGQLLQVEISRIEHHNGVSANPLQIDVVTTDAAGVPTATVLASATVPPGGVSISIAPLLIDVSAFNVFVQAGQRLGLALTSPNGPGTPSYAWWGEAPGGGYANGQVFIQQTLSLSVWDLAFQTWVADTASWQSYGAGHAGKNGVPSLASSANPAIGTAPNVLVGNSVNAATLGVLFFGLAPADVPTPWGGTALLQPLTSAGLALAPGGTQLPLAIPFGHSLCGFHLFLQAIVLDAGASQGIAFTPGLEYVLGH